MRNLALRLTLLAVLMVGFSGCEFSDAFMGGGSDPNRADKYEKDAEAGINVLKALSVFVPGLIPVASGAAGIYATWKRMKPKLNQAQGKAKMANNAGKVLAGLLEEIKINHPDTWADRREGFKRAIRSDTTIEQTVRGFRGLNPEG